MGDTTNTANEDMSKPTDGPHAESLTDPGDEEGLHAQSEEEQAERADVIRRLRMQGLDATTISGRAIGLGSGDAAETINNYYGVGPEVQPVDGRLTEEDLDRLRELYVMPGDTHRALCRQLHEAGVAILRGAPGTGRYTTAVLAAHEVRDADVVVLDPETDVRRLLHSQSRLQPGLGHVVEGDGRLWAANLRLQHLSRLKGEAYRRSPLVIIVDDQVSVEALDEYVVEHRVPDDLRFRVLEKRLTRLLADHPADCRKLLEHETLRDELHGRLSMTEVVRLARQLAEGQATGQDADHLVQGLRARLRARAEELLTVDARAPGGGTEKQEVSLWSRAFLLACVVLNGMPLSRVSRESHHLAELLHGVRSPSSAPEMPLFQESLKDWLHDCDVEFTNREGNEVDARHPECRVRMGRRGLGEAVLEVLWHDHTGARGPLLKWLDELVTRGEEDVRVAAAQAAGLLATFDWSYVEEELLSIWAADRSEHAERRRFAAAWALERAAADPVLVPRTRTLLRAWSRRRDYQACAMAAYGTGIGALFPAEALGSLERIARSMGARSVRGAVREIYAAGSQVQALEKLATWSSSPHYGLHQDAARCLHQLSMFRGNLAITGLLEDPVARGHLLRLARRTLLSRHHVVARHGWQTVRLWVERAGDEPGLDEVVGEFVAELPSGTALEVGGLRQRLLFYLRLWAHNNVGADAAAHICELVSERWTT
ncbi:hypothetical protein GCM10027168_01170 [Streptomyces capparidis]